MTAFNRLSYGEDVPVHAVVNASVKPLGFQQLTSMTAATALTPPAGARIALCDAEVQNVRWRDDGSAPTASVGMRMLADSEYVYSGNLAAIQFIAETAGAILNVSYYG